MKHFKVWVAAALLVFYAAAEAQASGILVARFGGEHGHPTTDNLTAMYYNPAGLALRPGGFRLYLDGNFAWRNYTYNRPRGAIDNILSENPDDFGVGSVSGTPEAGVAANSGEATLFNVLASPFIGIASDFGIENFGAGLSFYVPFGGQSIYDRKDKIDGFPGAEDGPQRWWTIEGTIRSLYITGAAAYRIPSLELTLGLGLNLVTSEVYTVRARLGSGHDHLVTRTRARDDSITDELLEGRAVVDLKSRDLSMGVGLIWEPVDKMWVGLSYQSQPGFGENELTGTARKILAIGESKTDDAELLQSMPDVIRAGWRMRTARAEYRVFGNFARWSVFEGQCIRTAGRDDCDLAQIPREWENGYTIRGGYSRFLGDAGDIEAYMGLGYDSSAVPDETLEPALPDFPKVTAALGARFSLLKDEKNRPSLIASSTYTQVFYFERTTDPRPQGDGQSNVSGTPFETARNPDSAGTYSQSVGVLNLNFEYLF